MRKIPLILTVDDEEVIHIILEKMICSIGYDPIHASGNRHAIEIIRELRPDLVLLDIIMPGNDSMEIIKAVRSDPILTRTGIILITHSDDLRQIARYIEAGADDFLLKPFNRTLFKARIDNTLNLLIGRAFEEERLQPAAANI